MSTHFLSLTTLSLIFTMLSWGEDAAPPSPPKKIKPHYAGAKRPAPKQKSTEGEKKRSARIKNEWVISKTHPKDVKKEEPEPSIDILQELPEDRPYFQRTALRSPPLLSQHASSAVASDRITTLEAEVKQLRQEVEHREGAYFPRTGFQAPLGHAFLSGEWLFWRTRQEGMDYATGKELHFDYTSGFRVGLGVHLPHDGWDIYANYTLLSPSKTATADGPTFPFLLYKASHFVNEASLHWKLSFQSVDLEIGRAFYIARTLSLRPHFGFKGCWIDQSAKADYKGGFIPLGETFNTHLANDFKGIGLRIGLQSQWHLGAGFNFFADAATALLIGQCNNRQHQYQDNDFEPVDMHTISWIVSPNLQLVSGLGWDRNFHRNQCHFGISAGFETQFYWDQNHIARFTNPNQPIYIRESQDLSFYGLTLRSRFDF